MRFYVNEEEADSSLVKPSNYTHHIDIKTTTLTHYIKVNKIKRIKLFKLEAEGFEPEILEGSTKILHNRLYRSRRGI